ncbi:MULTISPECIES: hypothetical protein [unclassified Campylobacter]|uniref:hypothetical protein n=1 Tax=unclassified Campylobacter TaxID=2593542 RepID=UPI001474F7EE|nr:MULTISPECIES: hypothetical protein [unclassified Campylobacter]
MRILFILAALLLVVLLFSIKHESLSLKAKVILTIVISIVCAAACFYQFEFENRQAKSQEILTLFNQGKILKCGDIEVSNSKFNYEFGTSSFVAKRAITELRSVKVDIKNCEAK